MDACMHNCIAWYLSRGGNDHDDMIVMIWWNDCDDHDDMLVMIMMIWLWWSWWYDCDDRYIRWPTYDLPAYLSLDRSWSEDRGRLQEAWVEGLDHRQGRHAALCSCAVGSDLSSEIFVQAGELMMVIMMKKMIMIWIWMVKWDDYTEFSVGR